MTATVRKDVDIPLTYEALTFSLQRSVADIAPDWKQLEALSPSPVYQKASWIHSWYETLGNDEGSQPLVFCVYAGQQLVALLPLSISESGAISEVNWASGKHSNFNFGLYSPDFLELLSDGNVAERFASDFIAQMAASGADFLSLRANPKNWLDLPHPLRALASQDGMTPAFSADISAGFETVFEARSRKRMRKKFRWQRRFLEQEGLDWQIVHSDQPEEIEPLLQAFFEQKRERFKTLGIRDIFGDAATQAFIRSMIAENEGADCPTLHFYGLEVDGKVIATYAGGSLNGRFSAYFNSFDETILPSLSAGEMLLGEMVKHRCEMGDLYFDLGMGDERYKHLWCDTRIDYFVCNQALSSKGKLYASALNIGESVKRSIRSNKTLWSGVRAIRRLKGKLTS